MFWDSSLQLSYPTEVQAETVCNGEHVRTSLLHFGVCFYLRPHLSRMHARSSASGGRRAAPGQGDEAPKYPGQTPVCGVCGVRCSDAAGVSQLFLRHDRSGHANPGRVLKTAMRPRDKPSRGPQEQLTLA